MPAGIAGPGGERVDRQFAAVGVDLAKITVRLIVDSQLLRGLENRERPVEEPAVWHSSGKTVGERRPFAGGLSARLGHGRAGCRGEWFFTAFVIDEHVHEINAVQVDVVAGRSQRTRGDVFAV